MPRSQKRRAKEARVARMVAEVQQVNELHAYAQETNRRLVYLPRSGSFYLLDTTSPEAMEQFLQRYKEGCD